VPPIFVIPYPQFDSLRRFKTLPNPSEDDRARANRAKGWQAFFEARRPLRPAFGCVFSFSSRRHMAMTSTQDFQIEINAEKFEP